MCNDGELQSKNQVVLFLPLPLAGYKDVALARGTVELAVWLNGQEGYPLKSFSTAYIKELTTLGQGTEGFHLYPTRISLPKSYAQSTPVVFSSDGEYKLPSEVKPFDENSEEIFWCRI